LRINSYSLADEKLDRPENISIDSLAFLDEQSLSNKGIVRIETSLDRHKSSIDTS